MGSITMRVQWTAKIWLLSHIEWVVKKNSHVPMNSDINADLKKCTEQIITQEKLHRLIEQFWVMLPQTVSKNLWKETTAKDLSVIVYIFFLKQIDSKYWASEKNFGCTAIYLWISDIMGLNANPLQKYKLSYLQRNWNYVIHPPTPRFTVR